MTDRASATDPEPVPAVRVVGVTRDFDISGFDRGQERVYQNGSDFSDDELVSYTARPIADWT